MYKPVVAGIASVALLATIGVGVASADPVNVNSRYFSADCEGEVLDFVTNNGASAHVIGDPRVAVLMGATVDSAWTLPIVKGRAKADLVECVYTQLFDGHQIVIYVKF